MKNTYEKGYKPLFEKYKNRIEQTNSHSNIELKGIKKFNISEEDAFFVLAYTGSYSSWLNSDLRNGMPLHTKCKKYFATRLCEVLNLLPSYNDGFVFRMDNPSGDKETVLNWFSSQINKIVKTPYFHSTSKDNYNNADIIWKIKTLETDSFGKDLSLLTNDKGEREILFIPNSYFKVKSVDKITSIIDMQEVTRQETFIELTRLYFEQ